MTTNNKLVYNVYFEEFNDKKIVLYNIFDHGRFYDSLIKTKRKYKEDFDSFANEVKSNLMYCFWSKSEYEIILTSWPPYVESEEIDRLYNSKKEHIDKYGYFYRNYVNLMVAEKVDIYDQIIMNWDIFIKYLWDNRNLIKKKKV